jgi:hypothetical protein
MNPGASAKANTANPAAPAAQASAVVPPKTGATNAFAPAKTNTANPAAPAVQASAVVPPKTAATNAFAPAKANTANPAAPAAQASAVPGGARPGSANAVAPVPAQGAAANAGYQTTQSKVPDAGQPSMYEASGQQRGAVSVTGAAQPTGNGTSGNGQPAGVQQAGVQPPANTSFAQPGQAPARNNMVAGSRASARGVVTGAGRPAPRGSLAGPGQIMAPNRTRGGYAHYDPTAFIPREQQPGGSLSSNANSPGRSQGYMRSDTYNMPTATRGYPRASQNYPRAMPSAGGQARLQPGAEQMYTKGATYGKSIRF